MTETAESPDVDAVQQGFRLDELTIDPHAGEVTGPGGTEKLDPKVMDVLVMLAQHPGQVVLREDMLTRLWPNAVVTDESLSRCIYELRRQLSVAGGNDRYKAMFETVPKRGYRLNGQVTPLAPQPALPSTTRAKWLVGALAAAVIVAAGAWFAFGRLAQRGAPSSSATAYSVAVLPFDDLSNEQDQRHFSDGVSEEILNRLSSSRTLKVIARPSSFSFRDESTSIPEIAEKLHVTHVLEGSVRKSGNHVRITVRLAEASSNSQLWSKIYDHELGDLFAVQDAIADKVATALNATLAGAAAYTPVPEAHDLFLQGEYFYNRRAPGDIDLAVKYYRHALDVDPIYAKPWAALAGAYSLLAFSGDMKREIALAKQAEAARKAVELEPSLAAGHARLAQYYFDIGDRQTSYRIFDRAIVLDPNDLLVLTFAAGMAMRSGDIAKAVGRYDRIVTLDPRSASHHANHGIYLIAAGRLDEAKAELQTAQEFNPDFGPEVDLAIARILVLQRKFEEARSVIARLPEGSQQDHGLALLYYAEGRQADANATLARLIAESTEAVDIRLAEVFAFRGMIDEAFQSLDALNIAIERNEASAASRVWSWQVELRASPFLEPLHPDPRWQALLFEPTAAGS